MPPKGWRKASQDVPVPDAPAEGAQDNDAVAPHNNAVHASYGGGFSGQVVGGTQLPYDGPPQPAMVWPPPLPARNDFVRPV